MSVSSKRRIVTRETLQQELVLPKENQSVVKLVAPRGNNLHQVVDGDGVEYLVSMPPRFRRSVWVKRGDFVIVEAIAEGNKVKAEIVQVLLKDDIKSLKENNAFPKAFCEEDNKEKKEDEDLLRPNLNHALDDEEEQNSSSSDSSSSEEEQEE